ncbi:MAG: methylated-DNA--[protein]-cysteine S-methyltransferase [Eggerthellaceae bacterium]|nr:methylated-DNA--[protein]-cysteine S-methyltransferase [Eggerthellaceae bacterium]MCH4220767.1 methylated-DNA--[protein]-cysteine S-methyltransferase [Eggerthellaceae bacterium]
MATEAYYSYATPAGHITIGATNNVLTHCAFGQVVFPGEHTPSALMNKASTEMQEYLAGKRTSFDIPLDPSGTEFQCTVWAELCRIPYGQTRSYAEVACLIGHPRSARAVGIACNRNPLPLFIPCHRVIASDGSLGGYAYGLRTKEFLLNLEHEHC